MNKTKVIFFGSFEFAVGTMEKLARLKDYEIVAVVTNPDKSSGRKKTLSQSPVKSTALALGLEVLQPEKLRDNEDFFSELKKLKADVGIVVGYSKILPPEVIAIPRLGMLNIHPSLLPKYRGPSPVVATLLNGESNTGVTIMKIDEEMDHGPILAKDELDIGPKETAGDIYKKLFELGTDLLIETLPGYVSGKVIPQNQDHPKATFSKMIKTEDAEIKPNDTIEQAINKIRAFNPEPGAYMNLEERVKVFEAEGSYDERYGWPSIKLEDGYLILKKVQPAGRKSMSGADWLRGQR